MSGETDLAKLISSMQPQLMAQEYVFIALEQGAYGDGAQLNPIAMFQEQEAMTLVVPREQAHAQGVTYQSVFRCITLSVHSSLDAVGLTAAVSAALASNGISANVIAAFYHDHIFVPAAQAQLAVRVLEETARSVS